MITTVIRVPGDPLIETLDCRGWQQGEWGDDGDGPVCAHGAIRLNVPRWQAAVIETVAIRCWSRGPDWNDESTEDAVRQWLAGGIEVTAGDLRRTYGTRWPIFLEVFKRLDVAVEQELYVLAEMPRKIPVYGPGQARESSAFVATCNSIVDSYPASMCVELGIKFGLFVSALLDPEGGCNRWGLKYWEEAFGSLPSGCDA